jgi:phi13 family phage major tail protein
MGRIRYGIKNGYYAIATDDGTGKLTYDTPVAIKGIKSVSLDAQSDDIDESADNSEWYSGSDNKGYDGTVEFEDTAACETFKNAVLGAKKDSMTGAVIENISDEAKEFAFGWETPYRGDTGESAVTGKRVWMLRCKAQRPSEGGESKNVGTVSVKITALPRLDTGDVKKSVVSSDTGYASFFSAVEAAA